MLQHIRVGKLLSSKLSVYAAVVITLHEIPHSIHSFSVSSIKPNISVSPDLSAAYASSAFLLVGTYRQRIQKDAYDQVLEPNL
jgi:hypothetical protein